MTRRFLLIFFLLITITIAAQKDTVKVSPLQIRGIVGLNISQVALENWTQGGDNTIAYTIVGDFGLNYIFDKWQLKNNLKVAFGRTKLGQEEFRTNDNEIYLENVLSYNMGWAIDPMFSNTIRTVLSDGFDYKNKGVQIASFFDPGYITQSLGYTYDKVQGTTTRMGIALQETFTNEYRQYSDDTKTKDKLEAFKLDTGIESVTETKYSIMENMLWQGKLRLFSRFNSLDVWDIRFDNTITAKINKYFNVNFNTLVIYQVDQSLKTQFKEAFQLGIVYSLF